MNELREAAIGYALRGWAVFPLQRATKKPDGRLVPEGYREASTFPPDALYWWERNPDANIGIACRPSGLIVIDIDERDGGYDTMHDFEQRWGTVPYDVPTQLTPTGGTHYLFKHPGVPLKGMLGPGVDIKDQGYILAAPSVHPKGGEYVWESDPIPEPGALPEAYVDALRGPQRRPSGLYDASEDPLLSIPADHYAEVLTGRDVVGGWMQCPFHKDGLERTPSLKVNGTMWACFGCEPLMGKQVMGGNLLDMAGMLKAYAMPLRGTDLLIVKAEMEALFRA